MTSTLTNDSIPAELAAHRERMDELRARFLREWEAENKDLPESCEKAMKCLRDWQEFLKGER